MDVTRDGLSQPNGSDALKSEAPDGSIAPTVQFQAEHNETDDTVHEASGEPGGGLRADPKSDLLPGEFDRFTAVRPLVRETSRATYTAHDTVLDRQVMLTAPSEVRSDATLRGFLDQAGRIKALRHPVILSVLDVGAHEGIGFVVTDPVEARSVAALRAERRFDWLEAAQLMASVAGAVAHAHAQGQIHGAIEPGRVLLAEGDQPVLTGFGLSRLDDPNDERRVSSYCAPEQSSGTPQHIDARTDVYALGAVLYWLLCGREPFRAPNTSELRRQIIEDVPQPPRQLVHGIPPDLEQICLQALAKNPTQRISSAAELESGLRRFVRSADDTSLLSGREHPSGKVAVPGGTNECEQWIAVRWRLAPRSRTHSRIEELVHEWMLAIDASPQPGPDGSSLVRAPEHRPDEAVSHAVRAGIELMHRVLTALRDVAPAAAESDRVYLQIETAHARPGDPATDGGHSPATPLSRRTSRLEAWISGDEIAVTQRCREQINRYVPCLSEPGHSNRVRVAMGDVSPVLRVLPAGRVVPLTGRNSQLAILKARWDHACEGMGQTVLVIGEEGMGKTRLVDALEESISATGADGFRIVRWQCLPRDRGAIYQPAVRYLEELLHFDDSLDPAARRELLSDHLADVGDNPSEATDILGALLGISHSTTHSPVQLRERARKQLLLWLRGVARSSSMLFVVEDLQWSDFATLSLLGEWLDHGFNEQILTVYTLRPDFETPWGSRSNQMQMALSRLTRRQVSGILASSLAESPSAETLAAVVESTGGVPLFVEDFVRRQLDNSSGAMDDNAAD